MPGRAALLLTVALWPATALAGAPDSTTRSEMRAGDAAYRAFDNRAARAHYARAHAADSTAFDTLWKLSRSYGDCALAAPKDQKKAMLGESERLARQCVALYPDSAHAHFVLALALGRTANNTGGKRRIALSREIRHEAQDALKRDPHHAGALHILGRWNYELASLSWIERSMAKVIYGGVPPGASMKAARDCFDRAAKLDPAVPLNHLWLGETLIKLHDYARARAELQACIELDDVFWDDHVAKERARKRLEEIEGKQ